MSVAKRTEIARVASQTSLGSPVREFLSAVLSQYAGDVDGALRILNRLLPRVSGIDKAVVADVLAPIAVMRHDNVTVLQLAEILENEGWLASSHSFRALAAADAGTRSAAQYHFELSRRELINETSPIDRFRVLLRLARTAYYLDEHELAIDLASKSAQLCVQHGATRLAAACYSIIYNVYHNAYGDDEQADHYAGLWRAAADDAQDESFLYPALVAEYEIAVQFGDIPRQTSLRREIRRRLLPEQYTERFPYGLSEALARGMTDLAAMKTTLAMMSETNGRSRGETSLCLALIAMVDASACQDDSLVRRSIRRVLEKLGRSRTNEPAYEKRYRRLARVSAAFAYILIGEEARAKRILLVGEAHAGSNERTLPELVRTRSVETFPIALRGLGHVFAAALAQRRQNQPRASLTRAEYEVLHFLAEGWTAVQIAKETNRSVNTVYNHTRSILTKLDASRAAQAVAIARKQRLID